MNKSKTACVLSSGGTRGTYQLGVLKAMDEKGIVFDLMVGASAGACNAARYVSRQIDICIHIWLEHCSNRRAINMFRLLCPWRTRPAMDLDYMFGDAIIGHEIDIDAIASSQTDVQVALTSLPDLQTHYRKLEVDTIFDTLIASCAVPYLYNKPAYLDGRQFIDGGLIQPIPVSPALDSDCNTIYVIEVRSPQEIEAMRKPGPISKHLRRFMTPVQQALIDRRPARAHIHDQLTVHQPIHADKNIIFIHPQKPLPVGRASIDKTAMAKTVEIGYHDGLAAL